MDKRPLPGWTFMIAGLLFMGYTKFIQSRAPGAKVGIFFYLGILFLLFGIYREFAPRFRAAKKPVPQGPPPAKRHHDEHPQPTHVGQTHQHLANTQHATHQHTKPTQHPSHPYQPQYQQCPRCHQPTHAQQKFCHNCGFQFR